MLLICESVCGIIVLSDRRVLEIRNKDKKIDAGLLIPVFSSSVSSLIFSLSRPHRKVFSFHADDATSTVTHKIKKTQNNLLPLIMFEDLS